MVRRIRRQGKIKAEAALASRLDGLKHWRRFRFGELKRRARFGEFLNARGLTGEAVEVGTHRGEFAEELLSLWRGRLLRCVDPYIDNMPNYDDPANGPNRQADMNQAAGRLKRFPGRAVIMRMTSLEGAEWFKDRSLDFVYVDAMHTRPAVDDDLRAWWPKVRPGGILAGHDIICGRHWTADWGKHVAPAVAEFAEQWQLLVYLVADPESYWSFYMVK